MNQTLDHPVVRYLIVITACVVSSVIFFKLGGSLAEVSGTNDKLLGFGFKASGAIGGFFLIFWVSLSAIKKLGTAAESIRLRVYVVGRPNNFTPTDGPYSWEGQVYDADTGETRTFKGTPRWEAGLLTLDFGEIRRSDLIAAQIKDAKNNSWQIDYFDPKVNTKEIVRN